MLIEIVKNVISKSELTNIQKISINRFMDLSEENAIKKDEDKKLIKEIANENNIYEVILSTEEVKIYTVNGKSEWDIKYPFRSIYSDEKGTWNRTSTVSPTLDIAFLVYLQYKNLGINSQFVDFAMKMLEITAEN